MATNYLTNVMGTGLLTKAPAPQFNVTPEQVSMKLNPQPALPTTTNAPTVTKTGTSAPSPSPVSSINLDLKQQNLLKTNNRALYDTLYGSTPAGVSATDIGTTGVNVGTPNNVNAQGNPADKVVDEALLQKQANQNPEQADKTMDGLGYTGSPNGVSPRDAVTQYMTQLFQEGQGYDPVAIKEAEGVYQAKKMADDLATDLEAYALQTRQEMYRMNQNPEGKLAGALQADMQNYEYDRYNRKDGLADIAIAARYAQGRYDSVMEIANDAIDREEMKYTRQMDFAKNLYTMLGDDMTDSEEAQFTSTLRMQEQATKDFMDTKRTMMERALNNKAPASVIQSIKNATSTEEAMTSAGSYGIDPNLTLAQDKFAWDRYYQQQQLNIAQQAKNMEITAKQAEEAKNISAVITDSQKNMAKIDAILGNNDAGIAGNMLGLRSSVGSWQGARTSGFFKNLFDISPTGVQTGVINPVNAVYAASQAQREKENFLAASTSLLNTAALQAFSTLSFSLAPVSNKEFAAVASSATNLGGKAIWSSSNEDDPNAKIIGFNGTEADLIKDFTTMRDNFQAGLEKAYQNEAWVRATLGTDAWNELVETGKLLGVSV
jgi:hypothetical protein